MIPRMGRCVPFIATVTVHGIRFIAMAVCYTTATADVFYVKTAAAGGSDAADGKSWQNAKETIDSAIVAAATGDEIWVMKGTYPRTTAALNIGREVSIYGGFQGTETALNQRTNDATVTIISAAANDVGLVSISLTDNVTLDGFTLTGASMTTGGQASLLVFGSDNTTIDNVRFVNHKGFIRGAVSVTGSANAVFDDCVFLGNSGTIGAGMTIGGENVSISSCQFIGNNAIRDTGSTTAFGGALYIDGAASVNITDSIFAQNTSENLGGVLISTPGTFVSMERCYLVGNRADDEAGVGQFYGVAGSQIVNSVIVANQADTVSAVTVKQLGNLDLRHCLVGWNTTTAMGSTVGVEQQGTLVVNNSIFNNNYHKALAELSGVPIITVIASIFYENTGGDFYDLAAGTTFSGAAAVDAISPASMDNLATDPLFSYEPLGNWTSAPVYTPGSDSTSFTDVNGSFQPGEVRGKFVMVSEKTNYVAYVLAATSDRIIVRGDWSGMAINNAEYGLMTFRPRLNSSAIDGAVDYPGSPSTDILLENRSRNIPGVGSESTWFGDIGPFELNPASGSPPGVVINTNDSDGDGFSDAIEEFYLTDRLNPNSYPAIGDFDVADGKLTIVDAMKYMRLFSFGKELSFSYDTLLDANHDGMLTEDDAIIFYRWAIGDVSVLPYDGS